MVAVAMQPRAAGSVCHRFVELGGLCLFISGEAVETESSGHIWAFVLVK
jgi:hypothetical protein